MRLPQITTIIAVLLVLAVSLPVPALTRPDGIQPLRSPAAACREFMDYGYVRRTDYRWCMRELEKLPRRHWNSWARGYIS